MPLCKSLIFLLLPFGLSSLFFHILFSISENSSGITSYTVQIILYSATTAI